MTDHLEEPPQKRQKFHPNEAGEYQQDDGKAKAELTWGSPSS